MRLVAALIDTEFQEYTLRNNANPYMIWGLYFDLWLLEDLGIYGVSTTGIPMAPAKPLAGSTGRPVDAKESGLLIKGLIRVDPCT